MKIEPAKLRRLIERASVWSKGAGIDPLLFDFGEKGIGQKQLEPMETFGCYMVVSKKYFKEYEELGEAYLPSQSIVELLKSAFAGDELIDLKIGEEEISLEGKRERYNELIPSTEVRKGKSDFGKKDGELVPEGLDIQGSYRLNSGELKELPSAENYRIKYGEKLKILIETEYSEFEKVPRIESSIVPRTEDLSSGAVLLDAALLQDLLSNFTGLMTFHIAEELVLLTKSEPHFKYCYVLAEKEE